MKRVTRSAAFALYGAFCGLSVGIILATVIAAIEMLFFGSVDGLKMFHRFTIFCSVSGFAVGLHYSLQHPPK